MPLSPRAFLQYDNVFNHFPVATRNAIYAAAEYRTYKKGEWIFRDGDEGPYWMGGVMSGRLRVTIETREGKELLLTMIEKGEVFGEMSLFDELPRIVNAAADVESTIMMIKGENFLPHLVKCPEAILSMFKITCRRMRLYAHRMELLGLQTVKQKLGRHLLHLAHDYGSVQEGFTVIDAPLSQADIASQLGLTRESVNKQINAFAAEGFLKYTSESITLCDIEGLKHAMWPSKD